MKRLREQTSSSDPVTLTAARIVQSISNVEPPAGLERRMRARLLAGREPLRRWRLQPIVVAAVILSVATVAGATIAVRAWVRHQATPASDVPVLMTAQGSADSVTAHRSKADEAPLAEPIVAEQLVVPEAPTAEPVDKAPTAEPPVDKAPAKHSLAAKKQSRTDSAESLLVLDATRALHREHDPKRALALLQSYLARYPHGDLVEESLALAVEAASAENDPAAATFARQYLERFPAGRFRELALRARSRFEK